MVQNRLPQWWRGSLVYIFLLIVLLIIGLVFSFLTAPQKPERLDLYGFIEQVKQGKVDTIQQDENTITGLKNDQKKIESGFIGSTNDLVNTLQKAGVSVGENGVKIEVKSNGFDWGNLAISFVPLILFAALLFLVFRSYRRKA